MFLKKNTLLRAREGSRELAVGDFTNLKLYWRHGTVDEISETKTPKPGEWWVRNDDGAIVFVCGCDPDGDPVWMDEDEELHNSMSRFFTEEYHYEPRCTGFDWVEPKPVAGVWPKWIIGDHWSDTAYVRRDSADERSAYTIDGKKRETKDGKPSHAACSIDSLINNKTWRYVTEAEALARVQHPTMDCPDCGEFRGHGHGHVCRPASLDPDDIPFNPVCGKVVATGTVKLTPVQLDDWVEFDATQITCPRVSVDWLTPRLGENVWGPALAMWSNATWAAQREIWKIRCRRCDLPIKPNDMAAIIAEHTQQVRELTQRIGDLVQQVNERDAVIEGIRTALHVD